jgi:uracil-DNA glycosylase
MFSQPAKQQLDPTWHASLLPEFDKPYMQELRAFLQAEHAAGHAVYPPADRTFKAVELVGLDRVSVVILGQDPYHGPGQAMGLSFSVPEGVRVPPSLKRVFKEIESDLDVPAPALGDLTRWAEQGVLLLNSVLTVRAGAAGSHTGRGWEEFTDAVLATINREREGVVFLLWGNYAKAKGELIDRERHLVLEAAHPSPLARTGWFGNRHFSQANEWLVARGRSPIDWTLTATE